MPDHQRIYRYIYTTPPESETLEALTLWGRRSSAAPGNHCNAVNAARLCHALICDVAPLVPGLNHSIGIMVPWFSTLRAFVGVVAALAGFGVNFQQQVLLQFLQYVRSRSAWAFCRL